MRLPACVYLFWPLDNDIIKSLYSLQASHVFSKLLKFKFMCATIFFKIHIFRFWSLNKPRRAIDVTATAYIMDTPVCIVCIMYLSSYLQLCWINASIWVTSHILLLVSNVDFHIIWQIHVEFQKEVKILLFTSLNDFSQRGSQKFMLHKRGPTFESITMGAKSFHPK